MRSHANALVHIQTSSESAPATPSWSGGVVLISRYLQKHGVLKKITEQVRFGRYER